MNETYRGTGHSETAKWECIELSREKSGKSIRFSTIIEYFAELNNCRMSEIAGAALIEGN
jgi:hypothetical protein